jgi:hypothetical protein
MNAYVIKYRAKEEPTYRYYKLTDGRIPAWESKRSAQFVLGMVKSITTKDDNYICRIEKIDRDVLAANHINS